MSATATEREYENPIPATNNIRFVRPVVRVLVVGGVVSMSKTRKALKALVEFWDDILKEGEPKLDGRELFLANHYFGVNEIDEVEKAYRLIKQGREALLTEEG